MLQNTPSKNTIYDSVADMPELLLNMVQLYGKKEGPIACQRLLDLMASYRTRVPVITDDKLTEKDTILITNGDAVQQAGEKPLITLTRFLNTTVANTVSSLHLHSFHSPTSTDHFSINDQRHVDNQLGSWQEISNLGNDFRLMFDVAIGHTSSTSEWFKAFLKDDAPFNRWFHVLEPEADLSDAVQQGTQPLLTPFETAGGTTHVWTSFGPNQVDLNFGNSEVLLAIIDLLLHHVSRGADYLCLNNVSSLWKKLGTACVHLPETHSAIQLIRNVLKIMAPHVALVTKINGGHKQNVAYFGNGSNEATMIYNPALAPLVLHSFHIGDTYVLSDWARSLEYPDGDSTFLNYLENGEGLKISSVRGLITEDEIKLMGERIKAVGGRIAFKKYPSDSPTIEELHIKFINALAKPNKADSVTIKANRFLASQAILLSLKGVPAFNFNSLYGSESQGTKNKQNGKSETVELDKVDYVDISAELNDAESLRSLVFYPFRHMIEVRSSEPAFNPFADQQILNLHQGLFSLLRGQGREGVLCIQNVTVETITLKIDLQQVFGDSAVWMRNVLNNELFSDTVEVKPYGVLWLKLH